VKNSPLLIVLGEPNSIFSEILFKAYKKKIIQKFNRPIVIIGSENLLKLQMKFLKYSIKFQKINVLDLKNSKLNKNYLNIVNVDYKFNKVFEKISNNSNNYINNCFKIALKLLKEKSAFALINGPISKTYFLEKKYLGITEYLANKINTRIKPTMLIYNSSFSVCPITTHLPIKFVTKNLTKKKIINDIINIDLFYKKKFNKKANFAILGLNPHCESISKVSEEEKIIKPALKYLVNKKIKAKGPFSADTFFTKNNLTRYDVAIGMYHDQVLTPMKTLFGFNAINLTLGLPFLRVSPDHGTNNSMIGKNKSNPESLISSINFFKNIK